MAVSLRTITTATVEAGIQNTTSIYGAVLVPPAKYAQRQLVYNPIILVDERDEKFSEGRGQNTAVDLANTRREQQADRIVRITGKGRNVKFVVRRYGYTLLTTLSNRPKKPTDTLLLLIGDT